MSRSAYSKQDCYVCGERISTAGFASTAHKRKHVREGILREVKTVMPGDWRTSISFEIADREMLAELYPESPLLKQDGR